MIIREDFDSLSIQIDKILIYLNKFFDKDSFFFLCDFDVFKFNFIICLHSFTVCSSRCIHVLVSYNGEWKQLRKHSGWTFTGKESNIIGMLIEIIYANLIDRLYDLLGYA